MVTGRIRELAMDMRRPSCRRTIGGPVLGLALTCVILLSSAEVASHTLLGRLELAVEPSLWASSGEAGFQGWNDTLSWKLEYPLDGWMAEIRAEFAFPFAIGERPVGTSVRARYAHSLGDLESVTRARHSHKNTEGGFQGFRVEFHGGILDTFFRISVILQNAVVRSHKAEGTLLDEMVQQSHGYSHTLLGIRSRAQLIEKYQRS